MVYIFIFPESQQPGRTSLSRVSIQLALQGNSKKRTNVALPKKSGQRKVGWRSSVL